jgi:hypothetical protein
LGERQSKKMSIKIIKAVIKDAFTPSNDTSRPISREIQKIAFAIVVAQFLIAISLFFAVKYDFDSHIRPTVTVVFPK